MGTGNSTLLIPCPACGRLTSWVFELGPAVSSPESPGVTATITAINHPEHHCPGRHPEDAPEEMAA